MAPPTSTELLAAADNFRSWLRWYMEEYPRTAPTRAELAKLIGVDKSSITLLLKTGSRQMPSLKTVWGFARLVGAQIDYVLSRPHPERHGGSRR